MIVNPRLVIGEGILKAAPGCPDINSDIQIQQNGIDLRLNELRRIQNVAALGERTKILPDAVKLAPLSARTWMDASEHVDLLGVGYMLDPEHVYSVETMEYVEVPANMCALTQVRSSLNRCGLLTITGVWDSGFRGVVGVTIRPRIPVFIEHGMRICQIVFYKADSASLYNGSYQDQKHQYDITKS